MRHHTNGNRARLRVATCLAVAAGLGVAATAVAAGSANPANGHTYDVVEVPGGITWADANAAAQSMANGGSLCPGHLATVTSQAESDFLVATFGGALLNLKWLGGFQNPAGVEPAGGWEWVTGEAWSYTNWGGSEPNNLGNEDALVLFFGNGTWNDAPEGFLYGSGGYVVEYDCLQVAIDIKPGSFPNSINNDGNGVIPVAILTTADFDAATVDPATVTLDGAAARMKGKSGSSGSLEDVDADGDLDLVVHIQDTDGTWVSGDSMATLSATTYAGQSIVGTDSIRLVPPES